MATGIAAVTLALLMVPVIGWCLARHPAAVAAFSSLLRNSSGLPATPATGNRLPSVTDRPDGRGRGRIHYDHDIRDVTWR